MQLLIIMIVIGHSKSLETCVFFEDEKREKESHSKNQNNPILEVLRPSNLNQGVLHQKKSTPAPMIIRPKTDPKTDPTKS